MPLWINYVSQIHELESGHGVLMNFRLFAGRELYSALLVFSMHVFILFILIKFQAKKAWIIAMTGSMAGMHSSFKLTYTC
jgi:hypothetical protein